MFSYVFLGSVKTIIEDICNIFGYRLFLRNGLTDFCFMAKS